MSVLCIFFDVFIGCIIFVRCTNWSIRICIVCSWYRSYFRDKYFFVLFSPFSFDWFYVRFYHAVLVSRRIYYIYSIILSVRIWVVLIILCQINALFLLWFKYHKNTYTHTAQNRCRFKWITVGIYSMNCKRNALNWMANYLSLYKLQITKMPNRIAEKNKHFINYSIPFLLDTPWKVYFERKMKEKKIARKLKKKTTGNEMNWNAYTKSTTSNTENNYLNQMRR